MSRSGLAGWREYVDTQDIDLLRRVLHPDVVFESPVVHTPQRGRDITLRYLEAAVNVLKGPAFRFTGEWHNDHGTVLELQTEIEGIRINGVDIIELSSDGELITHFKVMVRPIEAIKLLHRLMSEELAKV